MSAPPSAVPSKGKRKPILPSNASGMMGSRKKDSPEKKFLDHKNKNGAARRATGGSLP